MVTFDAPVVGGRVNTNRPVGSVMSIARGMGGVFVGIVVVGGGLWLARQAGGLPVIGQFASSATGDSSIGFRGDL